MIFFLVYSITGIKTQILIFDIRKINRANVFVIPESDESLNFNILKKW